MTKHPRILRAITFRALGLAFSVSASVVKAQTNDATGTNEAPQIRRDGLVPPNANLTNAPGVLVTNIPPKLGSDAPLPAATNLVVQSNTNGPVAAPTNAAPVIPTNLPGRPLYSLFKIINDRNIFDPNRRPGSTTRVGPSSRPVQVESFSLTGIISSDKGTYAFFDSSSFSYKKALKENGTIAGYTVTYIEPPDRVELDSNGKKIELTVGTGLRRREGGPWEKSDGMIGTSSSESAPSAGFGGMGSMRSSNNSSAPTILETGGSTSSSGGAGDALRRLMLKREQELKNEKP